MRLYKICTWKHLICFFIFCVVTSATNSQSWKRVFNQPGGSKVIRTQDNGYLVLGYTVMKTDSNGIMIWQKRINTLNYESSQGIAEGPAGEIYVAGYTQYLPLGQVVLTKLSADGDVIWKKTYPTVGKIPCAIALPGNDIVMSGTMIDSATGTIEDYFLMRTDSAGNIAWNKQFTYSGKQRATCVTAVPDGGFLVGGNLTNASNDKEWFVIKTDATGDTTWTKTLPATNTRMYDGVTGCTILKGDSLIAVSGTSDQYVGGMEVFTLRFNGDIANMHKYPAVNGRTNDIAATDNGGMVLAGSSYNSATWNSFDVQCRTTPGFGISDAVYYGVTTSTDNGYVLSGTINEPWGRQVLLKTDTSGFYAMAYTEPLSPSGSVPICKGDSVLVSTSAAYSHYQWVIYNSSAYLAGTVNFIVNANDSALWIDSTGNYQCMMWNNEYDIVYSDVITVVKLDPPADTISSSGPTLHCAVDDTISLTVTASNFSTYAWYLDGINLNKNTFKISPLLTGNYTASVTNVCGTFMIPPVYVNTNSVPDVSFQTQHPLIPYYIGVPAGSCFSYIFNLQKQPGIVYDWFYNGTSIGNVTNVDTVYFPGIIHVTATNGCGTSFSDTVEVQFDTLSLVQSKPLTDCTNQNLSLSAPSGSIFYQWYKNGLSYPSYTSNTIYPSSFSPLADTGYYYCKFDFQCKGTHYTVNTDTTYYLENINSQTITYPPSANLCSGNPIPLSVTPVAGISQFQWYFNDTIIAGAVAASYSTATSGTYRCDLTLPCGIYSVYKAIRFGAPDSTVHIISRNINQNCPVSATSMHFDMGLSPGQTANTTYQWIYFTFPISNSTNDHYIATQAGLYYCELTTACGTYTTPAYQVQVYAHPSITPQGTINICRDIPVTLSTSFDPGFTYQWTKGGSAISGATTNQLNLLNPTINYYNVIINNGTCVITSNNVGVRTYYPPAGYTYASNQPLFCGNDSVQLNVYQTAAAVYQWYRNNIPLPNANQPFYYAGIAGDYTVTVIDTIGCSTTTLPINVSNNSIGPITLTLNTAATPCGGDTVILSAPAGFVTYQWFKDSVLISGANTNAIAITDDGKYVVKVTAANGCIGNGFKAVRFSPRPYMYSSIKTDETCGLQNGTIRLYFSNQCRVIFTGPGGYYNAFYSTSPFCWCLYIDNLKSGWYTYTYCYVQGGCSTTDSVFIDSLNTVPLHISSTALEACLGSTIQLYTNSISSYNYEWSTGSVSNYIYVDSSGTYTLTVTNDTTGCTGTDSVTINFIKPPTAALQPTSPIHICTGDVALLDAGVANDIGYLWSNGSTNQTITANVTGLYVVTVTNQLTHCYSRDTAFVVIHPLPAISFSPPSPISICASESLTLNTTNGYNNYIWSTGDTLPYIMVNAGGWYSVTVTDPYSCSSSDVAVVNQSTPLNISFLTTDITCNGFCNGAIAASATGGTGSYTFVWNNVIGTGPLINNLCPGNYVLSISDSATCTAVDSAIVSEPAPLLVNTFVVSNTCSTCCDGDINAMPSGGTPNYIFMWSNGQSQQHIFNLCNGLYTVTVTDANGCVDSTITSFATGLASLGNTHHYNIFPNPVKETLNVSSMQNEPDETCLFLYNVLGGLINKVIIPGSNTLLNYNLDMKNISEGVYFLNIVNEKTNQLIKLTKL